MAGKEQEKVRFGMVGGGKGAFIGGVHRRAAQFDGAAELVAGCFSRDYEVTKETGEELGLDADRLYESYSEMAEKEADREDGIDFVSVVTPNNSHYEISKAFLKKGFNLMCEKPLTWEVEESEELVQLAEENECLFCVDYSYSGYPMVKQAREMVKRGDIGEVRVVMAEYPQDWLAIPPEQEELQLSTWRTDPEIAGKSNCIGDIGSHVEHTVSYITGLEIESLAADLTTFIQGEELEDNGQVMLKYKNGASGMYWASQIAVGHDNGLKVRVFGSRGGIEWEQEHPNELQVAELNQPVKEMARGKDYVYPQADKFSRIPPGHPEGYFEAYANVYNAFSDAVAKKKSGKELTEEDLDFPKGEEGLRGVKFIDRCLKSSQADSKWVQFE